MFIELFGKFGPNGYQLRMINTDLIKDIKLYKPTRWSETCYDIYMRDGSGFIFRVSEAEAKKLFDAIGIKR